MFFSLPIQCNISTLCKNHLPQCSLQVLITMRYAHLYLEWIYTSFANTKLNMRLYFINKPFHSLRFLFFIFHHKLPPNLWNYELMAYIHKSMSLTAYNPTCTTRGTLSYWYNCYQLNYHYFLNCTTSYKMLWSR